MNIHSDSHGDLKVTEKMTIAGQADQAHRRGGRHSSNQERGPGTLLLHLLLHLLHLQHPQQLQPLPLPEGPGAVVQEPCSETSEGDWLESSRESSRPRSRADLPKIKETKTKKEIKIKEKKIKEEKKINKETKINRKTKINKERVKKKTAKVNNIHTREFSPNRPSGPSWSSSRHVSVFVCLCVCLSPSHAIFCEASH